MPQQPEVLISTSTSEATSPNYTTKLVPSLLCYRSPFLASSYIINHGHLLDLTRRCRRPASSFPSTPTQPNPTSSERREINLPNPIPSSLTPILRPSLLRESGKKADIARVSATKEGPSSCEPPLDQLEDRLGPQPPDRRLHQQATHAGPLQFRMR